VYPWLALCLKIAIMTAEKKAARRKGGPLAMIADLRLLD